ncbi:non-ribosomal peptide synthetase [Chitinophaga sp. HK235]|uniref:non-ribosomal peptide synthetase n=1 Tax=Chitinophaga sp. HK235 TaxID=2952571 RepID=UPI001BA7D1E8|nr:non-ribosomal peptide synthetase [Chitinophaga sp. HK235]
MTDITALLEKAAALRVEILLEDNQLVIEMDEDEDVDDDFWDTLKNNKGALLQYLKDNGPLNSSVKEQGLQRISGGERIPLSFSQERLWLVDKLEGSAHYHIPSVVHMKGHLDRDSMEAALRDIVGRHEALRTVIQWSADDDVAWQHTLDAAAWQLADINIAETDAFVQKPFDLSADYMLRAALITSVPEVHTLVIVTHHISSDGWSESIIISELAELYGARVEKRVPQLPELPFRYADYAVWQRNHLTGKVLAGQLEYWKKQLSGVTALELPLDNTRPALQSTRGALAGFSLNATLTAALKQLSQREGVTLFMTLLAVFKVLLYRYSRQEDICVGIPVAGRKLRETEPMVGYFINTLAIRSNVESTLSFRGFLQQLKETLLQAYQHQDTPFEKVVDAVVTERELDRTPLFQVMFSLQNTPETEDVKLGDMVLSVGEAAHTSAKFDLSFVLDETPSGLILDVEYCTDLFMEETITRMAGHYEQLLQAVVEAPGETAGLLKLLTQEEEQKVLYGFNRPVNRDAAGKTIPDAFDTWVKYAPDAAAVWYKGDVLTYRELDDVAGKLANYLRSQGVKEDTLVPLYTGRGINMIVGIMAVLKAGGAYVPIDTQYPAERVRFMLDDIGASLYLTTTDYLEPLQQLMPEAGQLICIDDLAVLRGQPGVVACTDLKPHHLAYMIYTSGSTGTPKGVLVAHGGVVNLATSQAAALRLQPAMKSLQFASFGFDASCYEIFNTLLSGGCLVIPETEDILSAEKFCAFLDHTGVEAATLLPSYLHAIKDYIPVSLKTVVSAGEALSNEVATWIQSKGIRLINAYGPTENTVCASLTDQPVKENGRVVIGKPIDNVIIHILDDNGNPVPVGVPGEMYIGGVQVARGYFRRTQLTTERFVTDLAGIDGRMYKSGDLARWLPDGNIEFLGRKDDQVKIRGHRIELGEIENVLLQSGLADQAVVTATPDSRGNKQLVAYIVPTDTFDETAIAEYLKDHLPAYMVPAWYVEMTVIPLTANGKVDRRALPEPRMEEQASSQEYVAPRNATETALVAIWQELLGKDNIGIHDNFFRLGGDSIISIQLVSRARRAGCELQPKDVFLHQTVAQLAALATHRGATFLVASEQGTLKGPAGLLPIQQWFFEEGPTEVADLSHFNQSMLFHINKQLSSAEVSRAVEQLILHHDALRFSYSKNENGWQQVYGETTGAPETIDLTAVSEKELSARISDACAQGQQSLDITAGKLLSILHIITPETASHNRLFMAVHHLAIDGVSWRILLEDLEQLLKGMNDNLADKTNSYRQWYTALEQYSQSPALLAQQPYWERVMKMARPLPADRYEGTAALTKETTSFSLYLDETVTRRLLQEVPQAYNTEINDILLSALALTLHDWTGYQQIAIGLEGHGRENLAPGTDISRTTGWFTSMYPLLLDMTGTTDKAALIVSIKEQLRQVPDKGMGFGLLRYVRREPALQGMLPWNILFNYLGQFDNMNSEEGLLSAAEEYTGKEVGGNFPVRDLISINSMIQDGVLSCHWSYSSRHFEDATVQSLGAVYISHLQELINHCVKQGKQGQVFTPADYGLSGEVTFEKMDRFLNSEEDQSEDILSF